jgi:hypothetical protein
LNARDGFFSAIFEDNEGYLCIVAANKAGGIGDSFIQAFFHVPDELQKAINWIRKYSYGNNIYFCPQLFERAVRQKEYVSITPCAWADLDGSHIDLIKPAPSVVVESSPGKFHAYWLFTDPVPPKVAQYISKQIAYAYKDLGMDIGGWDITQLLRVPETTNLKNNWHVKFRDDLCTGTTYSVPDFAELPEVADNIEITSSKSIPDSIENLVFDVIINQHRSKLSPRIYRLIYQIPEQGDWSSALWNLECGLIEAGLTMEEAFVVCKNAACNKFKRDNRPDKYLWEDIRRAWNILSTGTALSNEVEIHLLSKEEKEEVRNADFGVLDKYVSWACSKGDAPKAYHEAGALTILSALLSGDLHLTTSFGSIIPNLWFMLLADTTLTRKSTAMGMAIDVLNDVDPQALLATDGTPEALLSELQSRPGIPSLLWRDEMTGLLEAMKKDYMADMMALLTYLYDGRMVKRLLRSGTIEVRDPRLIILSGGVRGRVSELLTTRHVDTGFLPRFLFVMGTSSVTEMRPMGPATVEGDDTRLQVIQEFKEIYDRIKFQANVNIQGVGMKVGIKAEATQEVWDRYNELEAYLVTKGLESGEPSLYTPMMDRLCKSILKVALLLAAARTTGEVIIERADLLKAIYLASTWQIHASALILEIGKSNIEKTIERMYEKIKHEPGCTKSTIMRALHITSKDIDWMLRTLIDRGLISIEEFGKNKFRLFPVAINYYT